MAFIPVANVTVAGFITNANPQKSDRGFAPFNGEKGGCYQLKHSLTLLPFFRNKWFFILLV
jgi:hypothetical protein